jgi:hypothetical protein
VARVIGCDIHWRNDVVSAALPVPSDEQFENYCAVILCTIPLHLTLAANVTVTTQDRAMRHTVIYSPQSICTVNSLHEKKIPCIIITVLKPVISQT